MNKRAIIEAIVAALRSELEGYLRSARSAHEEATSEQSKAENKYDTRGLEASYLAHGQSLKAAEIVQAIADFETLPVRTFGPTETIQPGALVEFDRRAERTLYFVGPRAGGTEASAEGREILVITPQSPLGRQLTGRKQGDRLKIAGDDVQITLVA